MKKNKKYFLIVTFVLLIFSGCSGSTQPAGNDDTPIVPPREEGSEPPPDPDRPLEIHLMRNLIDIPVEMFFYSNGRVPYDFEELKSSGHLLGIPRSPHNDEFYMEVAEISISDLSGFVYTALSEKAYHVAYLINRGEGLEIKSIDYPERIWQERLMNGSGEYIDAKLMSLMEFFPSAMLVYYRKHDVLAPTPDDMFEDYLLVEEGWTLPNESDDIYIEFGVDHANNKVYARYKYSFGFSKLAWQRADLWGMIVEFENIGEYMGILPYNYSSKPDELILNQWFNSDNLAEIYDTLVD